MARIRPCKKCGCFCTKPRKILCNWKRLCNCAKTIIIIYAYTFKVLVVWLDFTLEKIPYTHIFTFTCSFMSISLFVQSLNLFWTVFYFVDQHEHLWNFFNEDARYGKIRTHFCIYRKKNFILNGFNHFALGFIVRLEECNLKLWMEYPIKILNIDVIIPEQMWQCEYMSLGRYSITQLDVFFLLLSN